MTLLAEYAGTVMTSYIILTPTRGNWFQTINDQAIQKLVRVLSMRKIYMALQRQI